MIRKWESKYWDFKEGNYYRAYIDTTFAMYRGGIHWHTYKAFRTERPFTAKHVPWYYQSFQKMPDDERYYFEHSETSLGKYFKTGNVILP